MQSSKQVLFILAIVACSGASRPNSAEKAHRSFRTLNLRIERENDDMQIKNDLLEKEIAELHGKRWHSDTYDLHCTWSQSDHPCPN